MQTKTMLLFSLQLSSLIWLLLADDTLSAEPQRLRGLSTLVADESITLQTGPGGCSGTQEAVLDIYKSPNFQSGTGAPTVLHLPGGAYMNLVSDTVQSAGVQYTNAGYTVAVLHYRLPRSSTTTSWLVCSDPWEAINDVDAAMKFLHDNSQEYNIDPEQIVISGFSAGGHLAALYTSTCSKRKSCPKAQVLHFPFMEKGSQIFCSDVGMAFSNLQDYDACFPTALVDAATPPTILYHASGDTIVSTSEMVDFVAAMKEEGQNVSSVEYYEVPNGGHYLVPFSQVAAVSDGALDANGNYATFIDRALALPSPECIRCDDLATDWMVDNGKSCDNAAWHIANKCLDDPTWASAGYCRASCFAAGRGYPNEEKMCCPTKKEELLCTSCTNTPAPWMASSGKMCESASPSIMETNCRDSTWWTSNNYCQKACYEAGRGYGDGIVCC